MIDAKEMRNRLHLPEKIKIKDIAVKYFESELNKVSHYIENTVGPFGLTFSFSLKNILSNIGKNSHLEQNNYQMNIFKITKEDIEKGINEFIEELENSGYFVQHRYDKNLQSYIFAIYWTSVKKGE